MPQDSPNAQKTVNFIFYALGTICSIVLAFLVYQLSTRNLQLEGQIIPQAVFTGLVSGVLLFFSIIGIRRQELMRKLESLLAVLSMLFALFACEATLSFIAAAKLDPLQAKILEIHASGQKFDDRSPLEAIAALGNAGRGVTPLITPLSFMHKPLELQGKPMIPVSGMPSGKVCACNEAGIYEFIDHDRYGFNNNDSAWDKNDYDIVTVGDSFTYGICVKPAENFAGVLSSRYPNIINLGFPDRGPVLNYASMREYLAEKKFKTLLWFHYEGNDFGDLKQELQSPLLSAYVEDLRYSQNLKNKNLEIHTLIDERLKAEISAYKPASGWQKLARRFQEGGGLKQVLALRQVRMLFLRLFHQPRFIPDLDRMQAVVLEAKAFAEARGAKFIFVYLPSYSSIADRDPQQHFIYSENEYRDISAERKILAMLDSHGVKTLDMAPVLLKAQEPLDYFPFRRPGHYNAKGYRAIAEAILPEIDKK